MKKKKRIVPFILISIWILLFPNTIFSGEYILQEFVPTGVYDRKFKIFPENIEVCKAYEQNLNSFKDLPYAMVCERKVNPKFTDFKKPEWKELNVWENREMVWEIDKFLFRQRDEDKANWLVRLKKRIEENRVSLSETLIDINNGGKIDRLLKYIFGECDPADQSDFARPGGRRFIVWDDEKNELDSQLNEYFRIMQDIFIYKDKVYLDHFGGNLKFQDGTLSVFTSISLGESRILRPKICIYKYKDQTKGGK